MDLSGPEGLQLLLEALKTSGAARITLRGESMHPTLRDGWRLHVRALRSDELRVGDIGAFLHGQILTIHRLIWKKRTAEKEWLIFQGDNNPARELVAPEAVLGKVESAEVEREDGSVTPPFPVGADERAWFYRCLYRAHQGMIGLFPSTSLPGEGESGGLFYRALRLLFRMVEPIFAPRPRR
ncbi:MAG: S24/S26 family peptidase [Acidobacteria bacterium]|nr:S24/S26 family peptidase [Acidobacteriota bacterium]